MGATATPGVERGCGTRRSGAVYLEVGLGYGGKPIEFFLPDPPVPMTCDTKVGVELIERDGVIHVVDWIGEQHYPFAADALEEGRRYGFSRRVPRTLDLSRLTVASRILLVHARGLVTNHQALRPFMPDSYNDACGPDGIRKPAHKHHCGHLERTAIPGHHKPHSHKHACTRDLWVMPPATRVEDSTPPHYLREFASISYGVFPLSPDAPAPDYTSALVASLPITNISVIKARDGSHQQTLERVKEMLSWEGGLRISVTEADT